MIEDQINGLITVQSYQKDAYTHQHLEMLNTLGGYITIALENSKIHEEVNRLNSVILAEKRDLEEANMRITHLANHDNLTRLPNRRLLTELLSNDMPRTIRQKEKMAILYIDLDNFKPINDQLGHATGDLVLQQIAERFIGTLRLSDSIARVGGDEFVAVIKNVQDFKSVKKVANKIINAISRPVVVRGENFQLGASIGISIFPDDDESIEGLLKKADTAMYEVKLGTKNTYKFFHDLEG
jgi:diguanylate cyclase (GGDEF)-like protein